MKEEDLKKLITTIKSKKELSMLNEDFIKDRLSRFLKREPTIAQKLEEKVRPKSSLYKKTVKQLRAELRKVYGLYRQSKVSSVLDKLREELRTEKDQQKRGMIVKSLLEIHFSTRERLPFYHSLYKKIFSITGKPKVILDLGCGLNPLSFTFMNLNNITYYAYDINQQEINMIKGYFALLQQENKKFQGKVIMKDFLQEQNLPHVDVTFLFKMTDIIDQGKGHKRTELLLIHLPAKYVVVSFPTLTMSGKPMTAPKRNWVEWMCQRLKYKYTFLEFKNEIFYVIEK